MSTVIKSQRTLAGGGPASFELRDVERGVAARIGAATLEAAQVVGAARKEAAEIQRQAAIEGRQDAQHEAEKRTGELVAGRMQTVVAALESAVADLQAARSQWLAEWEGNLVHLAVAIAEKVIRREVERAPQIPLDLVRESLELSAQAKTIRIHLHPEDVETLGDGAAALCERLAPAAAAEIVADPAVERGGCLTRTEFGEIDQRIAAQLERIERELK